MRFVSSQPSVQLIPGLLALGEVSDVSGSDFLAAMVAGYEITGRLATGFKARPSAHQNGQIPMLGAVAAACRLKRLDASDMRLGLRLGAGMLMTPSYHAAVEGATGLNVPGGMSSFVATLVPDLVACGFTGQDKAIEEALGSLVGDGFDSSRILEALGSRWEITRNYFRMHAACNPIHPALDALGKAVPCLSVEAADIKAIEFETFRFASIMANPEPTNFLATKYSLPHAAATYIVRGGTSHWHIDDESLRDPEIAQLRRKVVVREDAALSARTPVDKPARVRVVLNDGCILAAEVASHRGDMADPYPEAEIREKFRRLSRTAFHGDLAALERAVDGIDSAPSLRALTDILAHPQGSASA